MWWKFVRKWFKWELSVHYWHPHESCQMSCTFVKEICQSKSSPFYEWAIEKDDIGVGWEKVSVKTLPKWNLKSTKYHEINMCFL